MKTFQEVLKIIKDRFESSFGQTPLRQRNDDILREAIELSRFTSIANLKEEHGDLLCSLLMSFQENGWDPVECVEATLSKIKKRENQYKAYGRKLNVAILGGAFDPIHDGHLAVAKFILDFSAMFDQVWLMPCYAHLYGKKMALSKHRLNMCKLASQGDRRIITSDYEIAHKLGGETYQLIKTIMNEDFAKHKFDFSFVIGMDNALSFDKWQHFEDLERMVRFVVVPRSGYGKEIKKNWFLKPPHMLLCPEKSLPKISSTEIRRMVKCMGENNAFSKKDEFLLGQNLHPDVLSYIKDHNLYA